MTGPSITVGVVAGEGPARLERTVGAVLGQLEQGDSLLVAMLVRMAARREAELRISEAQTAYRDVFEVRLIEDLAPCAAVARNEILRHAGGDVVVFLDDGGLPAEGWLDSLRAAYLDPGIDAVAGAIEPSVGPPHPGARPGGRLRWTGHLVTDYSATTPSPTSLASGRNCSVRRPVALKLGGFDEAFSAQWPYEDVEFFTRLAKAGGRTHFIPAARLFLQSVHGAVDGDRSQEDLLEVRAVRSRSMAAIFARHEAWALLIVIASHLLSAVIDVLASRLPRYGPARIARELLVGVRNGVRPVKQPLGRNERVVK